MGKKIRAKITGRWANTAYIALPGYPEQPKGGVVSRTICLDDLIDSFKGPRIHLDFDQEGVLIGIEILA